ncbi:MAG TPA: hypothetical protein GX518_00115 [Firmicutes bacterium]|nr:hypothetical protein [Bacillota bacterium]
MLVESLTIIIVLSVLNEIITEIIKTAFPILKRYVMVIAIVCGVVLCIQARVGLLAVLGVTLHSPAMDYILTGVIISRGSNVIHDLIAQLEPRKST